MQRRNKSGAMPAIVMAAVLLPAVVATSGCSTQPPVKVQTTPQIQQQADNYKNFRIQQMQKAAGGGGQQGSGQGQ